MSDLDQTPRRVICEHCGDRGLIPDPDQAMKATVSMVPCPYCQDTERLPGVITISSMFEDTPEGMHLMDRLRQRVQEDEDRLREIGGDGAIRMTRELEARFDRTMLYGDPDA